MKLLYNNAYWEDILGHSATKLTLDKRLHLIFSLVIFLQISVAKLLYFIFTSAVDEVKTRSSRFMGYTPSAGTEDTKFPPGMVFRAWLDNFPDAREHMHDMITPFVQGIVEKESEKMIRDVELKVKMKTLTLKGIQELLQPQRVMEKYLEHAPFPLLGNSCILSRPHQMSIESSGQETCQPTVPVMRNMTKLLMTGMTTLILPMMNR
jgi:hypothetical protein